MTLRYDGLDLIRPGWPPVGAGGDHMGKTNLLSCELVRCASQMLLPCSDIKLYRAHQ